MLLLPGLYGRPSESSSSLGRTPYGGLPISDAFAAVIADAFIRRERTAAAEPIARILPSEPGFALWCVITFTRVDHPGRSTFYDLAKRFSSSGGSALQWHDETLAADATPRQRIDRWRGLFEASIERFEIGRWTNNRESDLLHDPAAVVDLLHNADEWLATVAPEGNRDSNDIIPAWLTQDIAQRKAVVSACFDALDEGDRRAARRHAAAARDRWLAPGPLSPSFVPRLARLLHRLNALEENYSGELAKEKLEAMAEFAAGAGHEINNPLAVISGRAQLLVRGESDPERRRDLALIHTQAIRVYEMIADMMLAARPPWPELRPIELNGLLSKLTVDLAPKAQLRAIELRYDPPTEPLMVDGDPTQLTVAVRALCENALEAVGANGCVEVVVRRTPNEAAIEISVRDNGPGMIATVRQHLFDPYFSGREAGRGLGVGLSKCRAIIERHAGDIAVESEPGRGTTFTVKLPALAASEITR